MIMKMKRKTTKNAFTLIELLAVIVILAIIALIAVPVILNIIDKANKSAFKDTAYGIISAGELYFAEQQLELEGMKESKTFEFPNATGLEMKGKLPESGWMKVNTEGKVSLSVSNGRYCVTKGFNDTDVTVTEGECSNETKELALGDPVYFNPVINDVCEGYTEANSVTGIKTGCMRWYVYKLNGSNVGLILDHNTTGKVAWYSDGDDSTNRETNAQGPVTLMSQLKADTEDQGWQVEADIIESEDILNQLKWYQDLEDKTTWENQYTTDLNTAFNNIMIKLQPNMDSYTTEVQFNKAIAEMFATDYPELVLPSYLHEDLFSNCDESSCTTLGYWTQTPLAFDSSQAWGVGNVGSMGNYDVDIDGLDGLRPVINLSKNLIS